MASSFLGGGKQSGQSGQSHGQGQGQGQYGGSQQQGGNYSSDQTGNYSGAHQQQGGSSGGGGLMGMVSGYLPGHVSFYIRWSEGRVLMIFVAWAAESGTGRVRILWQQPAG